MRISSGDSPWILHVDLDQFQAAVEVRRRPELRGLPVVVGGTGDPTQRRMVVTCASYEARALGVRSGMPLRTALRRCPDAVFLPLDSPAYDAASEQVMRTLRRYPDELEVWGWDEAFLAIHVGDPEGLALEIRHAVLDASGLSCSIGIGDNKLRAKLATGFAKPAGIYRLTEDNWLAVMADRPTRALWGVGPRTEKKLAERGLLTVADLAAADPAWLAEWFGPTTGPSYRALGRGDGDTEVSSTPREPRSHSRQVTFPQDLTDRAEIDARLVTMAGELAREVLSSGRSIARVAVTVRTASFFTRTRITTLSSPTTDAAVVEQAALRVLTRFELSRPVRLLGVRVEFAAAPSSAP